MGIRVFGALRLDSSDGVQPVRGARERQVLGLLVARRGRVVPDDVLIEEFWHSDTDPDAARRSLRVRISRLRKLLAAAEASIEHVGSGYRLDCDPGTVDIERFRHLAAEAERLPLPARVAVCDAALGEWSDEPFAEFAYLDAFAAARSDLTALRRRVIVMRADALVAGERAEEAVDPVLAELVRFPNDEHLTRVAMRALAAGGRSSEALSVFAHLESALSERGLDPSPHTRALEEAILLEQPIPALDPPPVATTPPSVPQWEVPLGRDRDIGDVVRLAATRRLTTVTGPGGVGKTRVAAAAAVSLAGSFPAGVFWCSLADTQSRHEVEQSIAAALGLRLHDPAALDQGIAGRLGRHRGLIVLDNAEQVAAEIATAVELLLERCPGLHLLVTSQIALGVTGETRIRLSPLAVPDATDTGAAVASSPAVRLFHAAAARAGVATGPGDDEAVARLVRALDGLPLAIELAAARSHALGPDEIAARVGERLTLLDAPGGGGRRRSVEAAVEWSVGLLDGVARSVLGRLTVFAAGFSVDAAAAVTAGPGLSPDEAAEILGRLVDHSLVEVTTLSGRRRLHLLETIRTVASTRVVDPDATRLAHARWYAALLDEISGMEPADGVESINTELHQLRVAFDNAARLDHRLVLEMAAVTAWYWPRHGNWSMGLPWYDAALAEPLPDDADVALPILQTAAVLTLFGRNDPDLAEDLFQQADALARRHRRPRPFNARSLVASYRGDYATAVTLLGRQVDQDRTLGRSADVPMANLAHLHTELGDLDTAARYVDEAITESRRFGTDMISHAPLVAAQIAWQSGDLDEARQIAGAVLDRWRHGGVNVEHQASVLHLLCHVELDAGDLVAASAALDQAGARLAAIGRDVVHHLLLTAAVVGAGGDEATAADLTRAALDRLGPGEALFPTRQSLVGAASPAVPPRTAAELVRWAAAMRRAVNER